MTLLSITHNTSALSYQNNTNVQFTFSLTISVSISGNLSIDNLSPGTAKDSNIVDVAVATNNVSGYSLSATVGTNTSNTDLTNIANSSYKFTNLSSNVSTLTSFNDNTWGYSYSTDNGANWVSGNVGSTASGYNGLPLDTNTTSELGKGGITLIDTYNAADSTTIKFKIGAMSSSTQAAGTYTNTINFYAITKVPPISISDSFAAVGKTQLNGYYKMQDMSPTICNMVQTIDEDSQTQLIDIRDNKIYWVAKLQDGHCWMTQNLDLNLDSNVALTSNDTDLNEFGQNNYDTNNGYACSNSDPSCNGGIISWVPERSTIDAVTTESTSLSTISGWKNDENNPYSVDPGDWYWKGEYYSSGNCPSTSDNNYLGCNYMSKSNSIWTNHFSTTSYSSINGTHGHVGNYYNWATSIASNNASSYIANTINDTVNNPKNSICPTNWRLPIITAYTSSPPYSAGNNEFYNLTYYYGAPDRSSDQKLIEAPLYFTRNGYVWTSALRNAGSLGYNWSSTLASSTTAYGLLFNSVWSGPQHEDTRLDGNSIRCLAREGNNISEL